MASVMSSIKAEECVICFELLKRPRVLDCQHVFCINCLETLESNKSIKCPKCRKLTEIPVGLQVAHLPTRTPGKGLEGGSIHIVKHWEIDSMISDVLFDQESNLMYIGNDNRTKPILIHGYNGTQYGMLSSDPSLRQCRLTVDTKRGLIVAINATRLVSFDRGGVNVGSITSSKFRHLEDIAYHPGVDRYIVADVQQHSMYFVNPVSGNVVKTIRAMGQGEIALGTNMAIACDMSGVSTIWATTDWRANIVRLYDTDGMHIKAYEGKGSGYGQWFNPDGVCFDHQGSLLVSDTGNQRLVRLTPQPTQDSQEWQVILNTKGFGMGAPRHIAVTHDGLIAVTLFDSPRDGPFICCLFSGYT